jgi:two-component system chemotaxis sensor kinase CheA
MEIDLDKILQTYAAESEEHLGKMEEALVGLEDDPRDDKLLEAIFRGAHTIKGNSASLGFPKLAGFAHAFEDILQSLRNRTVPVNRSRVTLLLRAVDAMRQLVPQAVAGRDELTADHIGLLDELTNGGSTAQGNSIASTPPRNSGNDKAVLRRRDETQAWSEKNGTVRVDMAKLDRMLNLAGEIAIAQGRLHQALRPRGTGGEEAWEAHEQVERLTLGLQDEIMKLRMLPLGPTFRHYLRTVRDAAQAHGKVARLELEGEQVEVDVSVVEHLKDPLMHLIRNAIDHGIESAEKRQVLGKDPCGRLTLKAYHEGGNIVIQMIDDGAGLDRSRIIERARRMKILSEPEKLADAELFRLTFEPGFSTAATVTELSGRGVGMDVVRRNIEALRGSVAIESQLGLGTKITIRLPLTLAIIEGLGVGVGNETYVLPLHAVVECVQMPPDANPRSGQGVIDLRGEPLPYVRLRDWFQLPRAIPRRENIVVVEVDQSRAGLAVDALYGSRQTVIKPLGKQFESLPDIAGSTILGNGRVALILDVAGLVRAVMHLRRGVLAQPRDMQALAQRFAGPSVTECR